MNVLSARFACPKDASIDFSVRKFRLLLEPSFRFVKCDIRDERRPEGSKTASIEFEGDGDPKAALQQVMRMLGGNRWIESLCRNGYEAIWESAGRPDVISIGNSVGWIHVESTTAQKR